MEQEILKLTKEYFARMDEDVDESFQLAMIRSVIALYKNLRNYPESYTDGMIDKDVERYFERRMENIAFETIPEVYGRIGAEGLSMLTDAGTSRFFAKSTLLHDVTPICEVV